DFMQVLRAVTILQNAQAGDSRLSETSYTLLSLVFHLSKSANTEDTEDAEESHGGPRQKKWHPHRVVSRRVAAVRSSVLVMCGFHSIAVGRPRRPPYDALRQSLRALRVLRSTSSQESFVPFVPSWRTGVRIQGKRWKYGTVSFEAIASMKHVAAIRANT